MLCLQYWQPFPTDNERIICYTFFLTKTHVLGHPLARWSTGTTATPPDLPTNTGRCPNTYPAECTESWECSHTGIHAQLYPCMHRSMCAHTYTHLHTSNTRVHKHMHACTNIHTEIHRHMRTNKCAQTCAYMHTHMHKHTYTYTSIHMHTHMHMRTHRLPLRQSSHSPLSPSTSLSRADNCQHPQVTFPDSSGGKIHLPTPSTGAIMSPFPPWPW